MSVAEIAFWIIVGAYFLIALLIFIMDLVLFEYIDKRNQYVLRALEALSWPYKIFN